MLARAALTSRLLAPLPARCYNLHEYQSMDHMKKFGIPTPKSLVASTGEEAFANATSIGKDVVIKAQVLAGGRGKGHFLPSNFQGGVHLCTIAEAKDLAEQMLGQTLVTKQTGAQGKLCSKVMVAERVTLVKEYYLAFLLDRDSGGPAVVASPYGGMDIEAVAAEHPQDIYKTPISIHSGITQDLSSVLAAQLNITDKAVFYEILKKLYKCFSDSDLLQLEINPLGLTDSGEILVCDAKLNFDDNAKYRQKDTAAQVDPTQEDPNELEAKKFDLNYISLDGNIGCLVNGAGLAMATLDLIKLRGASPANFLDVGGGATEEQIISALTILDLNKSVEAILVNIFGGIMRCDIIARGLVSAVKKADIRTPIVARLCGTNWEEAKSIVMASGISAIYEQDVESTVSKAVAISRIARLAKDAGIDFTITSSS